MMQQLMAMLGVDNEEIEKMKDGVQQFGEVVLRIDRRQEEIMQKLDLLLSLKEDIPNG